MTVTNTSPARKVAFFLRADVRRGIARGTGLRGGKKLWGGNELESSIWAGNDITLWPGESQTLTVTYRAADLRGTTPVISVSGWNVPQARYRRAADLRLARPPARAGPGSRGPKRTAGAGCAAGWDPAVAVQESVPCAVDRG